MAKRVNIESKEAALAFARVCAENRCRDVAVLDLRGISPVTDFFVLATGTSPRQMRAVADRIEEKADELGTRRFGLEGTESAQWILMDYIDCVVHVFDSTAREYYDMDLLWGDAPSLDI